MTVVEQDRRPATGSDRRRLRLLGEGLLALAALLLLNTAFGPLVLDRIDYPLSESLLNQLIGLEVVTVALVVPWAIAAGVLAWRGNAAAPILGFAPAAYAAYMFVQYVLGPEYATYRLTPLFHLAIASLAGALMLASWTLSRQQPLPGQDRRLTHTLVLAGLATFVVMRYLPVFVGSVRHDALPDEFADSVTFFWSIVLLDLGVVVPAVAAAALAQWRGRPDARRALYAVLGWFALVPPSVAAMAAVMIARHDPNASWATTTLLATASVLFGWYAATVYRPLVHLVRREVAP